MDTAPIPASSPANCGTTSTQPYRLRRPYRLRWVVAAAGAPHLDLLEATSS